jgi:hypothetical protein
VALALTWYWDKTMDTKHLQFCNRVARSVDEIDFIARAWLPDGPGEGQGGLRTMDVLLFYQTTAAWCRFSPSRLPSVSDDDWDDNTWISLEIPTSRPIVNKFFNIIDYSPIQCCLGGGRQYSQTCYGQFWPLAWNLTSLAQGFWRSFLFVDVLVSNTHSPGSVVRTIGHWRGMLFCFNGSMAIDWICSRSLRMFIQCYQKAVLVKPVIKLTAHSESMRMLNKVEEDITVKKNTINTRPYGSHSAIPSNGRAIQAQALYLYQDFSESHFTCTTSVWARISNIQDQTFSNNTYTLLSKFYVFILY